MNKLIIIDHANIQFKSIFAWRNQPTVPVTWLYLSQITGYLNRIGVTFEDTIILGVDYGSWRKTIDKNYKAQRREMREAQEDDDFWQEMYKEFNTLLENLKTSSPFHILKIYNCEFDDIASCAIRNLNDYDEKIIISSDEDLQQLCVFPNVKVFSPYSKKYKIVKNPEKILLKKIRGDKSDNLLEIPKTEEEFIKRKMIVNLIELPIHIDQLIKEELNKITPKNFNINKIPFKSIQQKFKKIYKLES